MSMVNIECKFLLIMCGECISTLYSKILQEFDMQSAVRIPIVSERVKTQFFRGR